MDLETITINKIISVTSFCFNDGKTTNSFYITDYLNAHELLISAFRYIVNRKHNGYKVYFHNFSSFHAVFILNILSGLSNKIKPITRDNKVLYIRFAYGDKFNNLSVDCYTDYCSSLSND